jgi:uncharacterized alpha/beta hydrolase family protein
MGQFENKPFNKRAFISIVILLSGVLLVASGIVNHKLAFRAFTPTRHFWMAVHNMSALIFTICVSIHVSYNWKVLTRHANKLKSMVISKEAIWAIILVAGVVGLVSSHVLHVR